MFPRRTVLRGAGSLGALAVVAGCTTDDGTDPRPSDAAPERHEIALHDDAVVGVLDGGAEPSIAASRLVLSRCTAVVVGGGDAEPARRTAAGLGLPLLVAGPDLGSELDRLGVRTVVRAVATGPSATPSASAPPVGFGDREVVDAPDGTVPQVAGLPARGPDGDLLVVLAPGSAVPTVVEPLLEACRGTRRTLGHDDPRRDPEGGAGLRAAASAVVLGVGGLGPHFAQRVRTVRRAAEIPGGGWLPFPDRRMVALYGHPQTAALGMLGEQGRGPSVRRARALADRYAALTGDPVVPAFELIATVASGSAGRDGAYSNRTPVDVLRPWVETAARSGVYVVLDLQPGRADFLDQAKLYTSLLREPHVGLALDPEWRLGPRERPLQQIGHVDVDEVNRVGRWLARLVRDHDLPPKVLTLHQFRTSMIRGREDLDTGLDEIQWLVHADGQGSQPQKQGTWAALRRDLPEGVFLGWKNFEDEDRPMLTPEQTIAQVRPTPSFVSYQ